MEDTQKDLGEEIISLLKELGDQMDELLKALKGLKDGGNE